MGNEKWRPEKVYFIKKRLSQPYYNSFGHPWVLKNLSNLPVWSAFSATFVVFRPFWMLVCIFVKCEGSKGWIIMMVFGLWYLLIKMRYVSKYVSLFRPKLLEVLKFVVVWFFPLGNLLMFLSAVVTSPLKACYCFVKIKTKR